MLNDEEKEALKILKGFEPDDLVECAIYLQAIEKIKNLIEKQSKEIEGLKTTKKELTERVLRLESDKFWDNVVSKDKIKAKIEYYEKIDNAVGVRILESLLEKEFPVTITKEELEKRWKE